MPIVRLNVGMGIGEFLQIVNTMIWLLKHSNLLEEIVDYDLHHVLGMLNHRSTDGILFKPLYNTNGVH